MLGANDGLISTSSLVIGVAAAQVNTEHVLITGFAGLTAGALSMAAGEYVSVSSQADIEDADLALEKKELQNNRAAEVLELAEIYRDRGLDPKLAQQVAEQLMAHDALGAHARDELGMSEHMTARPLQAALASACSFAVGAGIPLVLALISPEGLLPLLVGLGSWVSLLMLGALAAQTGGASIWRGALRVGFWGALAMIVTALAGHFFGAAG